MPAFERELATYAKEMSSLRLHLGKYVLIKEDAVIGVYETYEDALKEGYEKFGLNSFLVKQIAPAEKILQFTRQLVPACL